MSGDDIDASHDPTKISTDVAPKSESREEVVVGSVWSAVYRFGFSCCAVIPLHTARQKVSPNLEAVAAKG